jgi:hypothetical protein
VGEGVTLVGGGEVFPVLQSEHDHVSEALGACLQGGAVLIVIGLFLGVVGQACQDHSTDLGVVHDDCTLGLAAHSHHSSADGEHPGLVVSPVFKVLATEEDIGSDAQARSIFILILAKDLQHALVQSACRLVEGPGGKGLVAPRGEAVSHNDVTRLEHGPESAHRCGEQELLDAQLDQHLDLKSDHDANSQVVCVLVHVNAATEYQHPRGLAQQVHGAKLQASLVSFQLVQLTERSDFVESDRVCGRELEGVAPTRTKHDGDGDLFVRAEFEAMAKFSFALLKHPCRTVRSFLAVVVCSFHLTLQSVWWQRDLSRLETCVNT